MDLVFIRLCFAGQNLGVLILKTPRGKTENSRIIFGVYFIKGTAKEPDSTSK
jgi:hypothetical protein